jgi:hypothetical protein
VSGMFITLRDSAQSCDVIIRGLGGMLDSRVVQVCAGKCHIMLKFSMVKLTPNRPLCYEHSVSLTITSGHTTHDNVSEDCEAI